MFKDEILIIVFLHPRKHYAC